MYNKCDNCIFHTIKKGDTLYCLSKLYDVPLMMILKANPDVDIYNLQIGEKVCIPVKGKPGYPAGDNMNNRVNNLRMQEVNEFAYVVRPNESLTDIMEKFNVSWDDIVKLNKPADILLKPGISLVLPLGGQMRE